MRQIPFLNLYKIQQLQKFLRDLLHSKTCLFSFGLACEFKIKTKSLYNFYLFKSNCLEQFCWLDYVKCETYLRWYYFITCEHFLILHRYDFKSVHKLKEIWDCISSYWELRWSPAHLSCHERLAQNYDGLAWKNILNLLSNTKLANKNEFQEQKQQSISMLDNWTQPPINIDLAIFPAPLGFKKNEIIHRLRVC